MLFRIRTCLLFIFLLLFSTGFSQQKWPNTFLWRISGKNLSQPSYLYGTIHLQDKRLFQFTDSLYEALQRVEGFALEVDFNDFMDTLFTRGFRSAEDEMMGQQKVRLDKKRLNKSADSLLKILGVDENNVTKKDLKKIRDYRMSKLVHQGEMKTIVDGYLYGLAARLGKWTGGIEDVNDQLDLVDEMGADLTTEEVFIPEASLRKSLEEMIKIYIKRDLQALADHVDGTYNESSKDKILNQRNIKMARRIDSLTALRTMFFGVGAAHLAGDSGLITLLRNKGFNVEPVFSPQSLSPEAYASKLNTIPWNKIVDDPLYSIEMPGKPSDQNIFGEVARMKIFFDLPTMTFYMAGHTIAGNNNSIMLDEAFNNMAVRMGSKSSKIQKKEVLVGNDKGREGIFDNADGSYKVRLIQHKNVLYMLLVGNPKRANLNTPDIAKFFASFTAKDVVKDEKKWTRFSIPGKAFTIELPGNAIANKRIDESASGSNWEFTTYDLVDEETGFYYLVQVRDLKPGYYLEGDSSYFSVAKQNFIGKFDKIISEEQFTFRGFPAFKIVVSNNNGMLLKFLNVVRGNRIYNLIVGGGTGTSDFSDVEKVFNSLKLEEYNPAAWMKYYSAGFNTTAPAPIFKIEDDSTFGSAKEAEHFVSYNSNDVNSYEIFKRPLSPYYWTNNDSTFFSEKLKLYTDYTDSIIERKTTYSGKLKGVEYLLQKPGSNTMKRVRMLINGDTLYTILAFIPKQYANAEQTKKFFEDFRIVKEVQPTIYTKKSKQLLEALKSKDSTEFAMALDAFDKVKFEKDDLPLLHQSLLHNYIKRDGDYYTVNEKLIDELEVLADSSTVKFVLKNYPLLNKENDSIKYFLLEVLANIKTSESYSALKKFLITDLPAKGDAMNLNGPLRDSLELTHKLYPEVLSLSKDSIFSDVLVRVTNDLIDSNLISLNEIIPFRQNFLANAKRHLQIAKEGGENSWRYHSWVTFIGKFNDNESNHLLKEFLELNDNDISYTAILALIRNYQLVNATHIEKIAEDKNYRKDLYDELKRMNKLKLYPPKFATQQKIAESEIYLLASDEEMPSSITFVGERTTNFMGTKQKFYLFKVSFEGDEYSTSYLGITGPYPLVSKEILASSTSAGVYWEEEYDKKKVDVFFKKYLFEVEKDLKERSKDQALIK